MAGRAGNIPVAGQDLVVKEKLAERGLLAIKDQKVGLGQRCWQFSCASWQYAGGQKRRNEENMTPLRSAVAALCILVGTAMTSPAHAEIEEARDLMESGKFEEAKDALWPAARSGNADAEELIGVMYAMGLGVERDDQRAFEWYLRSAMKGHPGAQSGVGWYYEIGRGMPAPDLVRAYMWYTLSAIGGDPDAAISLEEVVKKMTAEEIEKAHILVADYKVWMYPFR
jgi:TPR repeat protein